MITPVAQLLSVGGVEINRVTLMALLHEEGLRLEAGAEIDTVIAGWPIPLARLAHDPRRVVVFTRNDRDEWRGALLLGTGPRGFALVAQENRFRDLLHVGMWLRWNAQARPARRAVLPQLHPTRE